MMDECLVLIQREGLGDAVCTWEPLSTSQADKPTKTSEGLRLIQAPSTLRRALKI